MRNATEIEAYTRLREAKRKESILLIYVQSSDEAQESWKGTFTINHPQLCTKGHWVASSREIRFSITIKGREYFVIRSWPKRGKGMLERAINNVISTWLYNYPLRKTSTGDF